MSANVHPVFHLLGRLNKLEMPKLPPVILQYIKAYNEKDVDGMGNCLTDDVVFKNFSDGAENASAFDKAEFIEMARFGAMALSEREQSVSNGITVQNTTLLEISYTATVADDLSNGWKAGQELAFSGRSLFILRNGKIAELIDES